MSDNVRRERFEAVADLVWDPVRRYVVRRVGPDAAQDLHADVLLVLWRRLDDLPEGFELPWAYKVAQGCLANHQRGEQRHLRLVTRLRHEPPIVPPEHDEELADAMARLKPADQEVLRLWAWEVLEAKDIAVVLDLTPNAAAVRLSRAKGSLRDQLSKDRSAAGHKQGREGQVLGHE